MTTLMISTWRLKASIYISASLTHSSNAVKTVDWDKMKLTQETCVLLFFFDQGLTTNALLSLSKVRWADDYVANSHIFMTITTCFLISRLNRRHSMSLRRIRLLEKVRKQFSLLKQTKALVYTLQRNPFISQISIRLNWFFDRSFDYHDSGHEDSS